MKHSRVLITLVLGLGLTLALLWMMRGPSGLVMAEPDLAPVPPSLDRPHDPVVITGGLLSELAGSPLDEIFVYVYQGTTPVQIPFQIDERDASGMYVPAEDGQLDANDELVFMARDGGAWVVNPSLDVGGTPITPTHVIALADPIDDTHAWAYVFRSADLTYSAAADYVSYEAGFDRITGPGRYVLVFDAAHGYFNRLILGGSGQNLLDRSKLRIEGTLFGTVPFSVNEENLTQSDVYDIDGPVRVVRVSTISFSGLSSVSALLAYGSLVVQPATVLIPEDQAQVDYLRLSLDWNAQALGMVYYDANNPAGVTIDGAADVITSTPVTRWTQVAGSDGTVVNVTEIPAGMGGTQSTYYKDDSTYDSDDTGDHRSYGDAGFQLETPNPDTYTVLGHMYFLTEIVTNVGATYVGYYDNPLQVSVAAFVLPSVSISVTPDRDTLGIYRGETATYTLSLDASEGFITPISLTLQGAPEGTGVAFNPDSAIPPAVSRLYVTTTASTGSGVYDMTVTGSAGAYSDTADLTLIIASETPSFTLSISPTIRTAMPDQVLSYTVVVTSVESLIQPVTLTVLGLPAGVTEAWSVNPVMLDGASILTLFVPHSPLFGEHALQVIGTLKQVNAIKDFTLIIERLKIYLPFVLR